MKPKISVIMPVLNGERYIGEAIESIVAQTYRDYELIVVNDGSTDGTCEQVNRFAERIPIKIIHHASCQGIARSINDGIRASSGEFIAFLDHDDLWFPNFLETQFAYLQAHPDVGMVHSDFQTIDPTGEILEASVSACRGRTRASGDVFPNLFMDSFIVGNSVLIRKECFERLGLIDEVLRWGDYHMWLRIARHYKVDYVAKVLTKYRQHPTQQTRDFSGENPHDDSVGLKAIRSILELYPEVRQELGERVICQRMAAMYFDMAYIWFAAGYGRNARIPLGKAIRLAPMTPRFYVLCAASFLQPSQAMMAQKMWRAVRRVFSKSKTAEPSPALANRG